jgi:ubiquitin-like-conjugating enzyme ATG3
MDYLRGIQNTIYQTGLNIYSKFKKPPEKSEFLTKGILIPSEFVEAGDQLCNICPTWEWKPAANENLRNPYLPPEKQFLITRVPCYARLNEGVQTVQEIIDQKSGEQWICLDEAGKKGEGKDAKKEEEIEEFKEEDETHHNEVKKEESKEPEDIPTYGEDEDEGQKKTEEKKPTGPLISIKKDYFSKDKPADEKAGKQAETKSKFISIVQDDTAGKQKEAFRYYDVSIVYDMAFYTPRVFLMGYSSEMVPLKPEEIFEDISDEYAKKTVTIERHPALDLQQATVHPCRHADVMKHLIDTIVENGGKISPHQSLILFLKIFSAIMPNIKYDSTLDYDLE